MERLVALLFTDCDVKADTDGARAARIIDDLENFIVYLYSAAGKLLFRDCES